MGFFTRKTRPVTGGRSPAFAFHPRLVSIEDRTVPATFNVNSFLDTIAVNPAASALDASGKVTLRSAIMAANASPGADTILLPAGTYSRTLGGSGEDAAASGDLDVTSHLKIRGAGADATIIDAAGLDRVFQLLSTNVTISDLSIQGGMGDFGGGLFINDGGTATIENCRVLSNQVGGRGGGLVNNGTLTIRGSTISGNSGGGIVNGGTMTVRDSTISGNFFPIADERRQGGGILNIGTLTVIDSTLSGNSAGLLGYGGGISNETGTVTVIGSTLSGNIASFGRGGGIFNYAGTLTVIGSTLSGNSALYGGGIFIRQGNTVTVIGSTLSGNSAGAGGGGIYIDDAYTTLKVRDSSLIDNSAGSYGGGIVNNGGIVTVSSSTLSGNSAGYYGGGIYNSGTLTVSDSSLVGNSAQLGGDLFNYGFVNLFDSIIGDRYDA